MPTYDYLCAKCGEEFSRIMSFREREETKVTCPKCKSDEVEAADVRVHRQDQPQELIYSQPASPRLKAQWT